MENSTKPFPLVTGPIYFFDQMKPKIKKWEKREQDRQDSLISLPSHRKSTKYEVGEEARESVVTTAEDEDDSYAYSHILSVSRMSGSLKITKTCQQGYLFKEHKLMAAELLRDLGEMFQTYADYNFTFPVGVANLVSYSWYDLTEGSTVAAVRKSTLKIKDAMKRDYNSISLVSCNTRVTAGESYSEENYLMKVKSDSLSTSSKPMEKAFLVGQSQQSQNSHSIGVPVVIHFSLSSKKCLENGWISQNPSPPVDILMWKTTLNTAVKKLQVALSQIKEEEERLKKKGFNKQLILNHYTDTEVTVKERCNPQMTPCFWLELLKRKPQMPTVKTDSADVKKFHYALLDGSSLT
ncbi:uncharacterized protein LOC132539533 [Erinaceus europaeus]|uniref:Uncharacterized protein LOC132539533 n=1 Tax=Erinaceus europaeus TaxID=9365 RepID=A0ABM3XRV7_ERIEU|nr:uncharacterized protein LOC132539533 [Erinaceus europaeus]